MKKLILLSICLLLTIPCQARIIYVDADAPGANIGSSWTNAYNYLQDALSDANSNEDVNEIRVAQGIYKPTGPAPPPAIPPASASNSEDVGVTAGGRTATFQLINGVSIKGGYAGFGEPDPNARDIDAYETILSGDLLGNDGPDFANNWDNSYHVVTGSGTDANTVLDGFIITAGNANGTDWEGHGGGMYNESGSPTLMSCTFSGNSAHWGGGVCCVYSSNPILTNCTFIGNRADDCGGGIFCHYSSSPTIMSCTISQNLAGNHGGGIFCKSPSNPTIMNCAIRGNYASHGGGMFNSGSSSPTLTNCTFSRNSAYTYGGGGMENRKSSPTLTNCTFSGNSARSEGGGMYNREDSSPTVTNCTFSGNSARSEGGGMYNRENSNPTLTNCTFSGNSVSESGGGMYNQRSSPTVTNCTFSANRAEWGSGGMCNSSYSSPTVTNCTFAGNSAGYDGGGMLNYWESSPIVTNCTFSGNSAGWDGGGMYNYWESSPTVKGCTFSGNLAGREGGGMWNRDSNPTLANCILWGNTAPSGPQIYNDVASSATVSYSDVQGGWAGEGNIDADPCFVEPDYLGPISHWKFDEGSGETAYDSAGNYDGTIYGAQWTTGQIDDALSFDGVGGVYVEGSSGTDSPLNIYNSDLTISAWVKLRGPGGTIVARAKPHYITYRLLTWSTTACISVYAPGHHYICSDAILNQDTWYHMVGVFDRASNTGFLYVDGILEADGSMPDAPPGNNGLTKIGCRNDVYDYPFNGTIDEVMIFNRVLSAEEIQQLYQIGLTGHNDYHLLPGSPCINTGDPNYVPEPNETDLDGNPRVIGGRIDMGVYEFNHIPVADAGPDQTAYAWIDGIAQVTLDGTNSYDEDGQPLTYLWSWAVDGNSFTAMEAVSIIELPVGEHIIELIVNDGIDDSEPNQIVITVIEPMEAHLWIFPRVINRYSRMSAIFSLLRLPEVVTKDQVDSDQPLLLYPGGIEAIRQYVIQYRRRRARQTSILAFFDKGELMNAIPDEGSVQLQVVGRLKTGQYFFGTDTVRIIRRHRRPTGGSGDNRRVTVPLNR